MTDATNNGSSKPIRTMFLLTTMPVGGAETLLVNLVRRLDRARFEPEIACLKDKDELGEIMAKELTVTSNYLTSKYDLRVLPKLTSYMRNRGIDALVVVGAGDKMFWGRIAAYFANVPVVVSALHSTGWPDGVGRLNRMLTPITDGFIGVAEEHGRYLREEGGFPASKVHVISNGVDTDRFRRSVTDGNMIRQEIGIPLDAPVCGILAALRAEKNHVMFLEGAKLIRERFPDAHFIIVGDGPEREQLEAKSRELKIDDVVHFLGTRQDIPAVLAAMNVMLLTSRMEANPVSILEALSTEVPVVATRVGSVPTTVIDNETGFLVEPLDREDLAQKVCRVLDDPNNAERLGRNGRELVQEKWSVDVMVKGYEDLIQQIYDSKLPQENQPCDELPEATEEAEEELATAGA